MSLRVIAGSAKGTRLAPVPSGTRPLSDRAREGLFSSLGSVVESAAVLDLFAGTGAMGIEALSRGAASAVFVDSAPSAAKTIRENLRRARLEPRGFVRRQDVLAALRALDRPFDLVLLDPPYRIPPETLSEVLEEVGRRGLAAPQATLVLTRSVQSSMPVIPVILSLVRRLSYGDAVVLVFHTP